MLQQTSSRASDSPAPPRQPDFTPTVFKTSRQMDFFSESELVTQTGHEQSEWPLVFIKESIDNSLDACEEDDTPPIVHVTANDSGIFVADNGPGIPESTIASVLDFNVRASSREAYVTPTRGAQGNALMTLVGMPCVLNGPDGSLVIESHGECREIKVQADALTQSPEIVVNRSPARIGSKLWKASRSSKSYKTKIGSKLREGSKSSKTYKTDGTTVGIQWPKWPFDSDPREIGDGGEYDRTIQDQVFDLLRGYSLFNPHLAVLVDWFGRQEAYQATDVGFKKWRPNQPSSAHWYTGSQFSRLIGAYIAHDRESDSDRTVSEFLTAFDSLKGTAKRKQILERTGLARVNLSSLAKANELDSESITKLLEAMNGATKPIKPARLGVIGKQHMTQRLTDWGCMPESIRYIKEADFDSEGLPVVIEVVFGVLEKSLEDVDWKSRRQIFTGANFSAAIKNPFREFGSRGQGLEGALSKARASFDHPVIYAAHLTRPYVPFTDRGKTAIAI